ncbi:unnamed protein product [Rotaria sp. Silwood2]|nr:unnamed protein product [Rotaria sp. Silwood2]CAF2841758.1 unnamed protein product [Rotaria sp. Silwood2]CAF3067559.1 unnamed protein product [Rotaria sp. Silwood2]CAF4513109.1 unnamed protein product [Rotaria sp. Silwood2]
MIYMVLIIAFLMTSCNAGSALERLVRQTRGMCNIAYAACCLINHNSDAKCCGDRPCCPWANCATYAGR